MFALGEVVDAAVEAADAPELLRFLAGLCATVTAERHVGSADVRAAVRGAEALAAIPVHAGASMPNAVSRLRSSSSVCDLAMASLSSVVVAD